MLRVFWENYDLADGSSVTVIYEVFQFLFRHGYTVLFAVVLAEQIGLPIPAIPVLLTIGSLIGLGQFSFVTALVVAGAAAVLSDLLWYELGRRGGHAVLRLLCKISLEPDSCVRRTQGTFARYGPSTLLFAKFVPGLNTMAPPLAGLTHLAMWRFLICDGAGALIWAGAFLGAGYLFSSELERIADLALRLGSSLVFILALGLTMYILVKYIQRRRFFRLVRVSRITPEELSERLGAGEQIIVVDLRHPIEVELNPVQVVGALQMRPDELEQRHEEIPRDRDIVLYCT
jgi:membrane protein DedA with SNARE-associated domain